MHKLKSYQSLLVLITMAISTIVIFWFIPFQSNFIEKWYSRGLFSVFRLIWDHSFGFLPFGFIYLLISCVICYLFWPLISWPCSRSGRLKLIAIRSAKVLSVAIISFYWLWGFNYKRLSFREVTSMPLVQPDSEFVFSEFCRVTDSLVWIKDAMTKDSLMIGNITEWQLRQDLESVFNKIDLPVTGRVRVRKLRPKGILLHISTAGVYLPFTGEGHIDAGLHPITHPFTIMHEMSHGYGWTGEDVCNFLGLLGSINSRNTQSRYSGYFAYWRYLRSQIYSLDQDRFKEYYQVIPPSILDDYLDIIAYSNRYPDILPWIRDVFYDNYLKSHGISSGLVNYSQMVILSYQWQILHGSLLIQ